MSIITVPVSGEGFKPYEVRIGIGLLADLAAHVVPFLKNKRAFVVSDSNIARLHLEDLTRRLEAAGMAVISHIVPAGEASKNWDELKRLLDAMLSAGLDRKDVVLAFGGGVIGDMTGFASAIYMRGIDFIQIPTTVLAQVDSSVGGKTAIDHEQGKNLIGAFWQPRLVLCDLEVLKTLPPREVRCGYAEIIKYGLLGDADFFAWLESNVVEVLALEPAAIQKAVARSVEMKADIVAQDEREGGVRALLNLGHTFGHALEAELGFGANLQHGEAVGLGMAQAFRFSAREGLCAVADADRAVTAIAAAGLPTRLSDIRNEPFSVENLLRHMGHDKKAEGGQLTFILNRRIGQSFVAKSVSATAMATFLTEEGAQG